MTGTGSRSNPLDPSLPVSGLLRGELCEQLARRPARHVSANQFLYYIGEPASSLYFLKSGLVKTSRTSLAGDEMILHLHRPSEIFGELCLCMHDRRESAVTLEPSGVVEILRDDLLARLRHSSEVAIDIVTALSERLGDISGRLQSLSFESTPERLVRTLLTLADTLGEVTADGVRIAHYVRQEELAQMIGARREVVSGLLNRLRARGLIDYSRKGQISVRRPALRGYLSSLIGEPGK